MSVERSGQAIGVETLKGQLVTGRARGFAEGRQLFIDGTSRMNREVQARICEGLGVKFPGPTRRFAYEYPSTCLEPRCSCVRQRSNLDRSCVCPEPILESRSLQGAGDGNGNKGRVRLSGDTFSARDGLASPQAESLSSQPR
jgi:hypothetical protein